jgi:3-oxoacyl-[acyl-carrier-protein] synthase-3
MRLVGLSGAVPKTKVPSSLAYEKFAKDDVDRVVKNIGVLEHREAMPGTTAADLCIAATQPLLDKIGWDKSTVDGIIFITQSPDFFLPGTAHRIQNELKLSDRVFCFDVNLGCSGFSHGLLIAQGMIAGGLMKRALLMCGEVTTDTIGLGEEPRPPHVSATPSSSATPAPSARSSSAGPSNITGARWGADGSGMSLISVPGGAFRCFWSPELLQPQADEQGILRRPLDLRINGAAIFNFTIRRVPGLCTEALNRAGWKLEDLDQVLFHQANKFILDFLRKKMGVPEEKVAFSIEEYGNTSSASIPLTMITRLADKLQGRLRTLSVGFGSGLSWSAVAMETENVAVVPLIEV